MKGMKRTFIASLLALAMLASCGSHSTVEESSKVSDSGSSASSEAKELDPITITVAQQIIPITWNDYPDNSQAK